MNTADVSGTQPRIEVRPQRSALAASRVTLAALLLRDLVVLKKHFGEFVIRTLVQPFLLCFVFLFVFPKIGQGIGGHGATAESSFATVLVPGVVGLSIMFQGVQSIALSMAQEFGFTREIEDRVQAPCRSGWWQSRRFFLGRCRVLFRLQSSCPLPQSFMPQASMPTSHLTGGSSLRSCRCRVSPWDHSALCSERPSRREISA